MTIYAVPLFIQKDEIEYYCYDRCGKVIFAAMDYEEVGPVSFCHLAECPFLAGQIDEPIGEVGSELVYLRKLTATTMPCHDDEVNG